MGTWTLEGTLLWNTVIPLKGDPTIEPHNTPTLRGPCWNPIVPLEGTLSSNPRVLKGTLRIVESERLLQAEVCRADEGLGTGVGR